MRDFTSDQGRAFAIIVALEFTCSLFQTVVAGCSGSLIQASV